MLKSGIAPLDREVLTNSFGAISFDNKSTVTRLLMHATNKFASQGYNSLHFMPRSTTLDQIVQKYKPSGASGHAHPIYDFDAEMQSFKISTPLVVGSLKNLWDHIRNHPFGGNSHLMIFQFSERQNVDTFKELKFLQQRIGGSAFLLAIPAGNSPSPAGTFDYMIECQETARACQLRVTNGKNSGNPNNIAGPWEQLEADPTTSFWFSALPQPSALTLEAINARLYDLSSYDAQQKNPAEVKALLARWKELTKSTKSRPSFMS